MSQNTLNKNKILVSFSVWFIVSIYRKKLCPILKKRNNLCSFYPTCSEYGIMALQKHGFLKGWLKTIGRIKRCNKYRHEKSCVDYP